MPISNKPSYAPLVGECRNDNEYALNINNLYTKTLLFIITHQICYLPLRD